MTILNRHLVTGVRQVNSVDFVTSVFEAYKSNGVFAVLKASTPPPAGLNRVVTPKSGGGWLNLPHEVIRENRPAQIVFTSGTEGTPKAMLLSHEALADVVIRLNDIMKVDETIREYVGIPVTYSFGLGRCRAVAAAGGRCFIPENGFNPAEMARMLAADEINAISAVPTLWRTLLGQPEIIGALGKKVRWIEIGSQYMGKAEKEQINELFPNAIIVQHYGLTEASRTTFLNVSETRGDLLESVGQTTGTVEVKLSSEGRIMIRGPHLAMGQIIDGEIRPIVDPEGWYTTGDLGHLKNGCLFYEGRADDVINCAGVKIDPETLQAKINRHFGAENKVAVSRIEDALRGDGFFIAIEAGSGLNVPDVRTAALDELLNLGINAKSSVSVQEVARIPRTDTGKVQRKELSKLHSGIKAARKNPGLPDRVDTILDSFSRIFPDADIRPGDTFRSLGGDSLNYVQMLMLLEKHMGFAPPNWDKMSVEKLERIEPKNTSPIYSWLDTSVFLRVIAILGVVATHSGGEVLGGGTLLLFALIGYNMARFKSADFIEGNTWPWLKTYTPAILVPYFVVVTLYLGWHRSFELDELLLYANLVSAKITVLFPFWFVQVLIQCLILLGLIFSIPSLRRYASKTPMAFSFSVLACLIAIRAAYPFFWDTKPLNDLVPLRFMAILWLGWCFYFVESLRQRVLLCAIGIGFAVLDRGITHSTSWLVLGSVFLAFFPRVPVPAFAKTVLNDIGAATFYIFIFNGIIISILAHVAHIDSDFVVFCLSVIGSMSLWWAMERLRLVAKVQSILNAQAGN